MKPFKQPAVSFAGGEISEELYGRFDLDKFQTGMRLLQNFITLPHGPFISRPGFEYLNKVKTAGARLLPFAWSADQTMVLEFGHQYIRFHAGGETLLEANKTVTAVTVAAPGVVSSALHGFANGDWVYLSGAGFPAALRGRFVVVRNPLANTFEMEDLFGNAISTVGMAFSVGMTAARVFEVATPYALADLFGIHRSQVGDIVTLTHPRHPVYELRRNGALDWDLTLADFSPRLLPPATAAGVASVGTGIEVHVYGVTARSRDGLHESAMTPTDSGSSTTITNITLGDWGYAGAFHRRGMRVGATGIRVTVTSVAGLDKGSVVRISDVAGTGGITTMNGKGYRIRRVDAATKEVLLSEMSGARAVFLAGWVYSSGGTLRLPSVSNDLTVAGNKNTITWAGVLGADGYNVYKKDNNGGAWGFIGQTEGLTFNDNNILPDLSKSPPSFADPFREDLNYPGEVTHYEQRRIFAGSVDEPQTIWATRPGTESSFATTFPTTDLDALVLRVVGRDQSFIRHLLPLSDVVVLTTSSTWRMFTTNSGPWAPASVVPRQQNNVGAADVTPVLTSNGAIFVEAPGTRFHEIELSEGGEQYRTGDLSILTPHLVDGYTIADMAFSRSPVPLMWAVRNDGVLLGLTYLASQNVRAWHHTITSGEFKSVACVAEAGEDRLYAIVERVIDGQTVQYLERQRSRRFASLEDAFYLDSGLTYTGGAVTSLTGLWHLEGEVVDALADGAVVKGLTVANGTVTLDIAAGKVSIGLPYVRRARTLPLAINDSAGGRGTYKTVSKVYLRVSESSGIRAGSNFDNMMDFPQRTIESPGSPPNLRTGEVEIPISGEWDSDGSICIEQVDPVPLMVLSMTLEGSTGE